MGRSVIPALIHMMLFRRSPPLVIHFSILLSSVYRIWKHKSISSAVVPLHDCRSYYILSTFGWNLTRPGDIFSLLCCVMLGHPFKDEEKDPLPEFHASLLLESMIERNGRLFNNKNHEFHPLLTIFLSQLYLEAKASSFQLQFIYCYYTLDQNFQICIYLVPNFQICVYLVPNFQKCIINP